MLIPAKNNEFNLTAKIAELFSGSRFTYMQLSQISDFSSPFWGLLALLYLVLWVIEFFSYETFFLKS